NVAKQAAEQVGKYMDNNTRVLKSVGAELSSIALTPWQQERILKDYVLSFPEFRELTLFSNDFKPLATSALGPTKLSVPEQARPRPDRPYIAPLQVDNDLLPTTTIVVHLGRSQDAGGWVVGEISLESLWKMVDTIKVGAHGYALIVSEEGRLIAHGNP